MAFYNNLAMDALEVNLIESARYGDLSSIKIIIEARPDISGNTLSRAISAAADEGHLKVIKYLLEATPLTTTERVLCPIL
jgi:hypothetical protein